MSVCQVRKHFRQKLTIFAQQQHIVATVSATITTTAAAVIVK
jgi:hypothetical protein